MERLIRTQDYLSQILANNLSANPSSTSEVARALAQITGNYCHNDFEQALIGYGPHANGFIHVSIDDAMICHTEACANWREKLAKQFNISTAQISVVRTARPKAHFTNNSGVAVGHEKLIKKESYGTMCGFIAPRFPGDSYRIVSNNHVLAATNRGKAGDSVCAVTDWPYKIGELENQVILQGKGRPNWLDLAVARLDGYEPTQAPTTAPNKNAVQNEGVTKYGAKTKQTNGRVVSNDYKIVIDYDGESALFVNQLMIVSTDPNKPFSEGGDSGSMIKTHNGEFVGLLFAGNNFQTFANPSHLVIKQLQDWGYF